MTLASVLNVLWRRKWLVFGLTGCGLLLGVVYGQVVTPLYRATATVRPGITAYAVDGGPVREWFLKDVTHWFQRRMYLDYVQQELNLPEEKHIMIGADFILRGLQNIQGGNVITLTILDPDPQQAEAILVTAISAFNAYAVTDTISSQIELTRSGLVIQMASLENRKDLVASKRAKLDLDIAVARAESSQVESQMELLDLAIQKRRVAKDFYKHHLATLSAESLAIAQQQQSMLEAWPANPAVANDNFGDLVQGSLQIQARRYENQALADSIRYEMELNEITLRELRIKRDQELEIKKANLHRQVENLRLERDRVLAHEEAGLNNEIREKQAQLAMLAPIQKVGQIQVSHKPVRPRRLRAISILTALSLLGSLVVAFTWEYVSTHREEIFRPRAG